MERGTVIAVLGLVLGGFGLWLGLSGVGDDCGSAFRPDYSRAQFKDSIHITASSGSADQDCRDAVSARKPWAFIAVGIGAATLVGGIVMPSGSTTRRS